MSTPSVTDNLPIINGKIHQAINTVQSKIGPLEMTTATIQHRGGNSSHSYTYLSEPTLMDAIRPLLVEAQVAVYVSCEDRGKDGNMSRSRATLEFVHLEDGSRHVVICDGQATASDDKGLAMAHTSAVRQALHKTFMVPNYRQGDDPEQREAPAYQSRQEPAPEEPEFDQARAVQQLRDMAQAKGLEKYLDDQLAKANGDPSRDYCKALWKQIHEAPSPDPAPSTPEPEKPSETVG